MIHTYGFEISIFYIRQNFFYVCGLFFASETSNKIKQKIKKNLQIQKDLNKKSPKTGYRQLDSIQNSSGKTNRQAKEKLSKADPSLPKQS